MSDNKLRLIVHPLGADGRRTDREMVEEVRGVIEEALRERYTPIDYIEVQEVPPPQDYADIEVGTRVVVTPFQTEGREPYNARVYGYDMHRSKYRLDHEMDIGLYTKGGHYWAFVGQVEEHPDNNKEDGK